MELTSFIPSKYTWAGEQRKGMTCHITDSTDPIGHTRKAMDLEFFLAKPTPLPQEMKDSIEYIHDLDTTDVTEFWTNQLRKVRDIATEARPIQNSGAN